MPRLLLALTLPLLTSAAIAATDPSCAEHEKLRAQRDNALQKKDFKQYCVALSGLIRLMPEKPPAPAHVQCEANANRMKAEAWLKVRPTVIDTMTTTFDQNCR